MFTKILKYDFKFSYKVFIGMFLGVVAAFLLLRINNSLEAVPAIFLGQLITVVGVIVVAVASYVQVLQMFHRNFFGAEGYLMMTLPVSRFKLVVSKFIVALFWFNFMLLAVLIAQIILGANAITWNNFINMFINASNIALLITLNSLALVGIGLLFLTITLANSVFFGIKIHAVIAAIISAVVHFLGVWGFTALSQRSHGWVVFEHPSGWTSAGYRPLIGLRYGRIPLDDFVYLDIWTILACAAVAAGALALTMHLLKKHAALR